MATLNVYGDRKLPPYHHALKCVKRFIRYSIHIDEITKFHLEQPKSNKKKSESNYRVPKKSNPPKLTHFIHPTFLYKPSKSHPNRPTTSRDIRLFLYQKLSHISCSKLINHNQSTSKLYNSCSTLPRRFQQKPNWRINFLLSIHYNFLYIYQELGAWAPFKKNKTKSKKWKRPPFLNNHNFFLGRATEVEQKPN